jgi:hypothetical protein
LILSRFCSSIGVPATATVISNASHPRTQAREVKRLVSAQKRLYGSGQKHRRNGINRELFDELATFHLFETFLRLQVRAMQTSTAVDHQS